MKNFQKKGKFKNTIQSKPFLIFLGLMIIFFIYNMFDFLNKMEETRKNRRLAEDKIIELEKSKEKLNLDITRLKTDQGVEENIREKFGLAKEGEDMIMITDDKNNIEIQKKTDSEGFFNTIKSWFK